MSLTSFRAATALASLILPARAIRSCTPTAPAPIPPCLLPWFRKALPCSSLQGTRARKAASATMFRQRLTCCALPTPAQIRAWSPSAERRRRSAATVNSLGSSPRGAYRRKPVARAVADSRRYFRDRHSSPRAWYVQHRRMPTNATPTIACSPRSRSTRIRRLAPRSSLIAAPGPTAGDWVEHKLARSVAQARPAPDMAAMWALVLEACKQTPSCNTGPSAHPYRLGNPAPLLYRLTLAQKTAAFYDIVYGSNAVPLSSSGSYSNLDPGFNAGPGWDAATGLGAPFARNLIKAIVGI